MIDAANDFGLKKIFVHAFTDGRDVDPKSGIGFIKDLQDYLSQGNAKLASVIGRYYAMDRDKRWERVKLAYDLLVNGEGIATEDVVEVVEKSYADGITDEFIRPIVAVDTNQNPLATISNDDVVLMFNFRTDRGRQLTEVLSQHDFHEQNMHKLNLYYVTMTNYDDSFAGVKVIYDKDNIEQTLGEVLSVAGKSKFVLQRLKSIHMLHSSLMEVEKFLLMVNNAYFVLLLKWQPMILCLK